MTENNKHSKKGEPENADTEEQLGKYRQQIDSIDEQILQLMNNRISAALKIGEIKSALSEPAYYRPEREAMVLARLRDLNTGPMTAKVVESLFREIMSLTRGSEAGLSVSILGPLGTYSEAAARQHFGSTIQIKPFESLDAVFRAAENGKVDFAVIPIENSNEGGVGGALDRLGDSTLQACGEINFQVHHNLLTNAASKQDIQAVVAHPQSLAQCRIWLDRNLPGVPCIPASSNADGAVQAAKDPSKAAIAGTAAAERYELKVMSENIEDESDNTTRFLVLSSRDTPVSGDDKTSLLLSARNRPGALLRLLQPLLDEQIDMTRLESRPSKTGQWEYVFFVDILGHQAQPNIAKALQKLQEEAGLFKILGSYPRAQ